MKLIRKNDKEVVFRLAKRERATLLEILKRYPVLKAGFQPLSKTSDPQAIKADQELLDESLAEQKKQNRQFLQRLFTNPHRLVESNNAWRLTLETGEVEWFLQSLNDVRVGSWYQCGCPDEHGGQSFDLTEENLEAIWVMETAGAFQQQMIEALEDL